MFFFGFRLAQEPLVNSPNIDNQLLFPTGSAICTLSTFMSGGGMVGKCVSKENPKSDLDLDFVKTKQNKTKVLIYDFKLSSNGDFWSIDLLKNLSFTSLL